MNKEESTEWLKCAEDPVYFIENYVKVINLDIGPVNFKTLEDNKTQTHDEYLREEFQSDVINYITKNKISVIDAQRQKMGTGTVACAYLLWSMIFHDHQNCGVLALKKHVVVDLIIKIEEMYKELPDFIKNHVCIDNIKKTHLKFNNGSQIWGSAFHLDNLRGYRFNVLFIDQWLHIPEREREEFKLSYIPVLSSVENCKIIAVTTGDRIHSKL